MYTHGEIYSPNLSSVDFVHDSPPMPHKCASLLCFPESAEKCHLPWARRNQKNLETSSPPGEERNTELYHPGHPSTLDKESFVQKYQNNHFIMESKKPPLFSCWKEITLVPLKTGAAIWMSLLWGISISDSWQKLAGHRIFCLFTWGSFINLSNYSFKCKWVFFQLSL